ncbi:hypothetical protein CASFOL_034635 [Castilleja foliolosa]|uniref:Retrotransposon gag domain-containing protein n=1 Tax=Castilleja foliolosa TaxID=1961234 RepID=A0ABD3BQF2_9LAMI
MSSDDDTKKSGKTETAENKDLTLRIAKILRKENNGFARATQFMQAPNIEPKLNEKNYSIWARKVKIALGGRGRWHHITGVPEPPKTDEPDYYIWEQNDLQVLSWIIDSMESDLSGQFLEYPTARELWEGILQTYRSGEDALQIYDLNIQANRLQQGEQSIEKYYQNCQAIWREIDRRDPNDMETPNDILKFNKRMQTFRLYQFLHGADLKFDSVKKDLLKETPLPTVETAYSALRREAARVIIVNHSAKSSDNFGLAQSRKPKTETKTEAVDKKKLRCDHCNKVGHLKKGCFKLIGYPDWFENNPKFQRKGKKGTTTTTATAGDIAAEDPAENGEDLGFAAAINYRQRRQAATPPRRTGTQPPIRRKSPTTPPPAVHLGKRSAETRSDERGNNGAKKIDLRSCSSSKSAAAAAPEQPEKMMMESGPTNGLGGPTDGLGGPNGGLSGSGPNLGSGPVFSGNGPIPSAGPNGELGQTGPIQFGSLNGLESNGLVIKLDGLQKDNGLDQVTPMDYDLSFLGLEDFESDEPLNDPGSFDGQLEGLDDKEDNWAWH